MTYLGNPPDQQAFAPAVDYFSGNGSTTSFTLSRSVGSVAQLVVVVANVVQNPSSAYTVNGNTITFTGAPPAGTNNIWVNYTSPITQLMQPGQGTVGAGQLDVAGGGGTGAAMMPVGSTAQRPPAPQRGMFRMNSTTLVPEWYDTSSSTWVAFNQGSPYTVEYLVIAGGGGGDCGGGGAGGVLNATATVYSGSASAITIGAGGLNPSSFSGNNNTATSGSNSSFGLYATAIGGGAGKYQNAVGLSGGSGGGGGYSGYAGGSGTSGQGNAGGTAGSTAGGGGGGAGAAGGNGSGGTPGAGGIGTGAFSVWASATSTGASGYYAGGGGGGGSGGGGAGGTGGGGTGATGASSTAGAVNTGGGGGGIYSSYPASNGGSGIVIIRYAGSQRASGGAVTTTGGYTYHTFITSGTFTA